MAPTFPCVLATPCLLPRSGRDPPAGETALCCNIRQTGDYRRRPNPLREPIKSRGSIRPAQDQRQSTAEGFNMQEPHCWPARFRAMRQGTWAASQNWALTGTREPDPRPTTAGNRVLPSPTSLELLPGASGWGLGPATPGFQASATLGLGFWSTELFMGFVLQRGKTGRGCGSTCL